MENAKKLIAKKVVCFAIFGHTSTEKIVWYAMKVTLKFKNTQNPVFPLMTYRINPLIATK